MLASGVEIIPFAEREEGDWRKRISFSFHLLHAGLEPTLMEVPVYRSQTLGQEAEREGEPKRLFCHQPIYEGRRCNFVSCQSDTHHASPCMNNIERARLPCAKSELI